MFAVQSERHLPYWTSDNEPSPSSNSTPSPSLREALEMQRPPRYVNFTALPVNSPECRPSGTSFQEMFLTKPYRENHPILGTSTCKYSRQHADFSKGPCGRDSRSSIPSAKQLVRCHPSCHHTKCKLPGHNLPRA